MSHERCSVSFASALARAFKYELIFSSNGGGIIGDSRSSRVGKHPSEGEDRGLFKEKNID